MKKKRIGCAVGAIVLLIAGVCLLAGMLGLGITEFKNLPRMVTGFDFGRYMLDGYVYSGQQQAVVDQWGAPQSFYILFYQREDADGRVETVRYEEWAYPARGKQVVFENGAESSRAAIPAAAVYSTRYSPQQFFAFMNREQLASLTDLDEWFILPVEEELVPDADLYYAGGLTFGLENGELLYVEAVHFEDPDAPPASGLPMTVEEAASQGTQTYSAVYIADGAVLDEETTEIAVSFAGGNAVLLIDGETLTFAPVGLNQYIVEDTLADLIMLLTFTPAGLTIRFEEEGGVLEAVFTRQASGGSLTPEEAANQGTHTYDMVTVLDGDEISKYVSTFEISFYEGRCKLVENGEAGWFTRTGLNQYVLEEEDDTIQMTFYPDGLIWTLDDGVNVIETIFTFQE